MSPTAKYTLNSALIGFVIIALGYGLFVRNKTAEAPDTFRPRDTLVPAVEGVEPDFAVYFFYNDVYCETCNKLEGFALEAVQSEFEDELKTGLLQWRSLDMTTPKNSHYVEEFGLFSKSIVLVAFESGKETRWENLEDIWDRIHDEGGYKEYINASLRAFMGSADE